MTSTTNSPHFESVRSHIGKGPTLFLMRHAERDPVPEGANLATTFAVQLTEKGIQDAKDLGEFVGHNYPHLQLDMTLSSPVKRCKDTAINFLIGGKYYEDETKAAEALILDPILAGRTLYTPEIGAKIICEPSLMKTALEGGFLISETNDCKMGGELLTKLLKSHFEAHITSDNPNSFGITVSHDMIMVLLLAKFFNVQDTKESWPGLLEVYLIQKIGEERYRLIWRDKTVDI